MGTLAEGQAFASLGTSGVLFAANDAFRPNAGSAVHAFCHAVPGRWHQMGVILAATDALNWLARVVGEPGTRLGEEIERATGARRFQLLDLVRVLSSGSDDSLIAPTPYSLDDREVGGVAAHGEHQHLDQSALLETFPEIQVCRIA